MFCPQCGVENKSGTQFCTACGEKFVTVAAKTTAQTPAPETGKHGILFWLAIIAGILVVVGMLGIMIIAAFVFGMPSGTA